MPRKKQPETPPPEKVGREHWNKLVSWCDKHREPRIRALLDKGDSDLAWVIEQCLIKKRMKDVWHRDWYSAYQNWVMMHIELDLDIPYEKRRQRRERPVYDLDHRQATKDPMEPLGDVVKTELRRVK